MTIAEIKMKKTRRKRKSPNGEGCITRNKKGYWEIRLTTGYDANGKMRSKYFTAKTQEELLFKRDKYKEQQRNGLCAEAAKITVGEWLDYWYENYIVDKVKVKTRSDYESSIRCHLKPHLGRIKLIELKGMQIQEFYNQLSKNGKIKKKGGLSPKSIRNIHIAFHKALEQAVYNDFIVKNPSRGVKLPKQVSKPIEILNQKEQRQLVEKCFNHPWGMAIFLTLFSGMRLGEVLGLKWKDIDFKSNCISVNKEVGRIKNFDPNIKSKTLLCLRNETKTSSSTRNITVGWQIMEKLAKHKTEQNKHRKKWEKAYNNLSLVFCREDGNLIDPKTFRTFYLNTLKKAGIGHKKFHALRHTFATRALEENSNIKVISKILGHAGIQITLDTYSHVSQDLQQETMQNLADKLLSA